MKNKRTGKDGYMDLKLDIAKAYDTGGVDVP